MPRPMSHKDLEGLQRDLVPLLAPHGWGASGGNTREILFVYPAEADNSSREASLRILSNRLVDVSKHKGGAPEEHLTRDAPVGRGWRKQLIEDVVAHAKRLVPVDPPDLSSLPILEVPRMSEEDLRKFVLGVADNQIFTSAHLRSGDSVIGVVFMPLVFGAITPPDEILDGMPEDPEDPGPKPTLPEVDFPENPESSVLEPVYPEEPTPPTPDDVPRHLLESVEWGALDESEIVSYREGRGAFPEQLAVWKEQVWKPWKDITEDIRCKYEADLANYHSQIKQWENRCDTLRSKQAAERQALSDKIPLWETAHQQYLDDVEQEQKQRNRVARHYLQDLGVLWEWMHKAGPRSVNGYPTFASLRLMHREDWSRALKALQREQERRDNIVI